MNEDKFVPIMYRINALSTGNLFDVVGFAFQTPGWPEFHACVRRGNRRDASIQDDDGWIVDHYETGLAISPAGEFSCKEDAPAALAAHLDSVGRERVTEVLHGHGIAI